MEVPLPDLATLQPATALDDLEASMLTAGQAILRRLLQTAWEPLDAVWGPPSWPLVARSLVEGRLVLMMGHQVPSEQSCSSAQFFTRLLVASPSRR